MHPNPAFRQTPQNRNIVFARARSFGVLAVNDAEDAPLLSHIPFQLSEDGSYVEAHLVRSNPILGLAKEPVDAVIAVSGGDAYISPDWYGVDDQVPTWNYVAVHLRGRLKILDQTELHGILERLSASMETRLDGKKPWAIDKMDQDVYARMQRQIVPIALDISEINGTWKLSQNKPDGARMGAAHGVEAARVGHEIETVARLMREAD
ncbi:MAG: FMN-binding negative transcriptional regulator [Pseudomonadota bacterium]